MKYHIMDESFAFPGKEIGCLLIHGFTGAPSEVKPLGEYLAKKDMGAYGVRLKGHGTSLEDMVETSWADWYNSVQEGMEKLNREYEKIFVIGLSMGGLLALKAASEHKVAGVVSINAPIFIPSKMLWGVSILKNFVKYYPKKHYTKKNVDDFENLFYYDKYPLKGIDSLLKLRKITKKQTLKKLDKPLLVIQSKKDKTVVPKSGQYIYDEAHTEEKRLVWLEEAGHIATVGKEQDKVFYQVEKFIQDFRHK